MLSEVKQDKKMTTTHNHGKQIPLEKIEQNLNSANGVLKALSTNEEGKTKSSELYMRQREEIKNEFINTHKDNVASAYKTYLPEISQYLDAESISLDFDDRHVEFKCWANRNENKVFIRLPADISSTKSVGEADKLQVNITNVLQKATIGIQIENAIQHELGHFIWSMDNLLSENSHFKNLINHVTQEVSQDQKNKTFEAFEMQHINSAFSDLGEGFSVSMELILLEKELTHGGSFSKDEVARYLKLRKDRFMNENISTSSSPDEKALILYDGISVIYRIYKDFEKEGKGDKAVADFIRHCDVEKLISIKKYEEGYFIKRELPSKEEIAEKTKEQEKLCERELTKEEEIKLAQKLNRENLERQINEYETMIGRKLTEKEIKSFTYNGIIGNKLTEEYKRFVKMSGKEIMQEFLVFEV